MFPSFPTPYTVTKLPYAGESSDGLGNTVPSFGPGVPMSAIQLVPHTTEQGSDSLTETQQIDVDLYLPAGSTVDVKDRIDYENNTFEVVGVQDWNKGFHGWQSGFVAQLKRVS